MTITAAATGTPLGKPSAALRFVDENGMLTNEALQMLSQWREFFGGMNRIIPCNASGTNVITLTPLTLPPSPACHDDHGSRYWNPDRKAERGATVR